MSRPTSRPLARIGTGRRTAPAPKSVAKQRDAADPFTVSNSATEQRRTAVAYELLRGCTDVTDLADRYGCQPHTILRDIQAIDERLKAQQQASAELVRAREIRRLEMVIENAWKGWDKSREDAVETRTSITEDGEETTVSVRGQAGDPRFLNVIKDSVDGMLDIRGLRIKKISAVTPEGDQLAATAVFDYLRKVVEEVGDGATVVDADYIRSVVQPDGHLPPPEPQPATPAASVPPPSDPPPDLLVTQDSIREALGVATS